MYIIFVNVQVSVAVLLDNFIAASAQMEQVERETETAQLLRDNKSRNPLEPLLEQAMRTNLFPSSSPPSRSSLTPFLPLLRPEYCVSPSPPALGFSTPHFPYPIFPSPSLSFSFSILHQTHTHPYLPPTHPPRIQTAGLYTHCVLGSSSRIGAVLLCTPHIPHNR